MVATTNPEQTKTGRSFSQFGRKSIGCPGFMPDGGGAGGPQGKNYSASTIQEEASRVFKNCKSEHIKNYTVRGTRGESIGLLLVEMASKFVVLSFLKSIHQSWVFLPSLKKRLGFSLSWPNLDAWEFCEI